MCALQVPPAVPHKALGKFPEAVYEMTGGTCSACFFRPVMNRAHSCFLSYVHGHSHWKIPYFNFFTLAINYTPLESSLNAYT